MKKYIFCVREGDSDIAEAIELRLRVFCEEQKFTEGYDDIDKHAFHFLLFDGDKAVAVARAFDSQNGWHIGRVAVDSAYRRSGVGRLIMEKSEDFLKSTGVTELVLSSQDHAIGFYEKLGYKTEGHFYMDEHCPHIDMRKKL